MKNYNYNLQNSVEIREYLV